MAANPKKKLAQTMAERADIHELYEKSVQAVDVEVEFLQDTFRSLRHREALSLREDFCGTASLACEWVRTGAQRHAIGVDIDASVLDWGRRRRVARLPEAARARVKLLNDDVRRVVTEPVDIVGAFNFSYFCFKAREEMRDYFKRVHAALRPDGVFFLDAFGGPEASDLQKEKTKLDGFTYVWDQARVRARHEPHRLPHPLQVPGRLEDQAGVHIRLAPLDAARAPRAAARGGLREGPRLLGRR